MQVAGGPDGGVDPGLGRVVKVGYPDAVLPIVPAASRRGQQLRVGAVGGQGGGGPGGEVVVGHGAGAARVQRRACEDIICGFRIPWRKNGLSKKQLTR